MTSWIVVSLVAALTTIVLPLPAVVTLFAADRPLLLNVRMVGADSNGVNVIDWGDDDDDSLDAATLIMFFIKSVSVEIWQFLLLVSITKIHCRNYRWILQCTNAPHELWQHTFQTEEFMKKTMKRKTKYKNPNGIPRMFSIPHTATNGHEGNTSCFFAVSFSRTCNAHIYTKTLIKLIFPYAVVSQFHTIFFRSLLSSSLSLRLSLCLFFALTSYFLRISLRFPLQSNWYFPLFS